MWSDLAVEFWIVDWSQGIAGMPFPRPCCCFVKLEDVMGGGISFLAVVAVRSLPWVVEESGGRWILVGGGKAVPGDLTGLRVSAQGVWGGW